MKANVTRHVAVPRSVFSKVGREGKPVNVCVLPQCRMSWRRPSSRAPQDARVQTSPPDGAPSACQLTPSRAAAGWGPSSSRACTAGVGLIAHTQHARVGSGNWGACSRSHLGSCFFSISDLALCEKTKNPPKQNLVSVMKTLEHSERLSWH